jgi:hypothetical protein
MRYPHLTRVFQTAYGKPLIYQQSYAFTLQSTFSGLMLPVEKGNRQVAAATLRAAKCFTAVRATADDERRYGHTKIIGVGECTSIVTSRV